MYLNYSLSTSFKNWRNSARFVVALCCITAFAGVTAQTASPYSRYGLGHLRTGVFSANKAMGEVAAPYASFVHINHLNPASYASLSRTTIEAGANLDISDIGVGDSSYRALNGSVSHLAVALARNPLIPKPYNWAVSFGLLPYTNMNYTFLQNFNDTALGPYRTVYSGRGSLHQVYAGGAFKIKGFSVGLNLGYVFGKLDYQKSITFPDTVFAYSTRNVVNLVANSFSYNAGVQYQTRIFHSEKRPDVRHDILMTAGAYLHGGAPLNANVNGRWERFDVINGLPFIIDTPQLINEKNSKITMPIQGGLGVMFGNEQFWLVATDFKYANWSSFNSPFSNDGLTDSWRISLGMQIIPNIEDRKYFNKIQYRVGGYYGKSEVMYQGQNLQDLAVTMGLGFPFKSTARLNVSAIVGTRGNNDAGAIRETYYRLNIGLVLNDIWFNRRRLD